MVADVLRASLSEYPPELLCFATVEAERDAVDVVTLLDSAGLAPPGEVRGLPPGILLDLGGVVRLRRWESAGFTVHLEAGLPTACEALHHVIRTLVEAAANRRALTAAGVLGRAVFDLMASRFAWTARAELGSDVVLDLGDEDALVDGLARVLWAHRHDCPATE